VAYVPLIPTCEGCSSTQENTEGMVSLRKGGMRTWLCFSCIDALKARIDIERAKFHVGSERINGYQLGERDGG
jgi:hypothetical protein